MPNKFLGKLGNLADSIKDAAEDVIDRIDDKFDMPIIIDFVGIKRAGDECYTTARETSGLCRITIEKANEMVQFGQELQTTLDDVTGSSTSKSSSSRGIGSMDASKFAIIQDLMDGDRIQSATNLARELSELSLKCVDKSQEMILSMERGIDALPDAIEPFVENKMKKASSKGGKNGDPELPDIDQSVNDMKKLVKDIKDVNLFTVVKSGSAAFDGLRKNGELSSNMFHSINNFACDVESVSGSFRNLGSGDNEDKNPAKIFSKMKTIATDAWRCLRLSGLMKLFAEKVQLLIQWIISLFQIASTKLGTIWGALSNARDVLGHSLIQVKESIRLCDISKDKSILLRDTSKEICDHLKNIVQFRTSNASKAFASLKDLADGDEIMLCIQLATGIDDEFTACTSQVIKTIEGVDDAIRNMPDVLIPELTSIEDDDDIDIDIDIDIDFVDDEKEVNKKSRGGVIGDDGTTTTTRGARTTTVKKVDVGNDVRELDEIRNKIEDANALTVISHSLEGFVGINDKIGMCGEMITTSRGFAESSLTAIDSFQNGSWDLEVASAHILELFHIRTAGKQMKVFIESILQLVRANIELLKTIRSKSKGGSDGSSGSLGRLSDIVKPGGIKNLASSIASNLDVDDLKGIGEGLKKFGSLFKK